MERIVEIKLRDGRMLGLTEIPEGRHQDTTIAVEMSHYCQKAYERGRQDEAEAIEEEIRKSLLEITQSRKNAE